MPGPERENEDGSSFCPNAIVSSVSELQIAIIYAKLNAKSLQ